MKYIVFTDMDGTLIDHDTYSYKPAEEALSLLKNREIPLIFCTSKTRAEIEVYTKEMGLIHPFISENGGAIFIPLNYFNVDYKYDYISKNYHVIELGTKYQTLRKVLEGIRSELGLKIVGFGDLTPSEISEITGLDLESAKLAGKREYDEAFTIENDGYTQEELQELIEKMISIIKSSGLSYTKGGRFWHLMGDNDKGKAVKILSQIYEQEYGPLKTIGLGDSLNDLSMLHAVDIPVLVQKPGGIHDPEINDPRIKYSEGVGPVGWNLSLKKILSDSSK
ncbi:mannosyl-3-phosphoglycerate phosphatase [Methanosalsum zhilinae DSM 4017]|uniref:Mannosyl-3-phosphoglycerate phosphatase n=1 Tax=Methanosalsum zhilinae (strain DSM 4017 / NBRC 107636 / OCM 62 / WeN5) TaxID=679901 RepID=F7XNF6_METZD|nr:mannosyl-3-phosphoglycerate phosphatase [Methanosalsum zhilinae]AEH61207.1 mannosyl-3-phosphoglycerate phosphatase [Methanosalsum zhilinae DSM 4017]